MAPLLIPASYLPLAYSIIVGTAMLSALLLGMRYHFADLTHTHCNNAQFWPSISSTVGDFLPERAVWRIALTLSSPARFLGAYLLWDFYTKILRKPSGTAFPAEQVADSKADLPLLILLADIARMACAIGWTYVASFEVHSFHELSFYAYVITGFVFQVSQLLVTRRIVQTNSDFVLSYKLKWVFMSAQVMAILGCIVFYIQHNNYCTPYAFSMVALCEWIFAMCNIAFDATTYFELRGRMVMLGSSNELDYSTKEDLQPVSLNIWSAPSVLSKWIADVYMGYLFHALFVQLLQTCYFVPMVMMAFSWEALMGVAPFAPLLLCFPRMIQWAMRTPSNLANSSGVGAGVVVAYAVAVASLFSFDVTTNANNKLLVVGAGCAGVTFATHARLFAAQRDGRARILYCLPLGIVLNLALRVWYASVDPFMVNPFWNAFSIICGIFSVITMWREYHNSNEGGHSRCDAAALREVESEEPPTLPSLVAPTARAIMFGCLEMFSIVYLTHHGTVARWIGVDPYPSGLWIVFAFFFGLGAHHAVRRLSQSGSERLFYCTAVLALGGVLLLCFTSMQSNPWVQKSGTQEITEETAPESLDLKDWFLDEWRGFPMISYAGGIMVALSLGLAWPYCVGAAFPPILTFGGVASAKVQSFILREEIMIFVTIAAIAVCNVYVVYFPFVPFGRLFRNRFHLVTLGTVVTFVLAFWRVVRSLQLEHDHTDRKPTSPKHDSASQMHDLPPLPRTVFRCVFCFIVACIVLRVAAHPGDHGAIPYNTPGDVERRRANMLTFAKGFSEFYNPKLRNSYQNAVEHGWDSVKSGEPLSESDRAAIEDAVPITTMIWTIHFGLDNNGNDNFERLKEEISKTQAGVIGLLESDMARMQNGNRDAIEYVSHNLGFPYSDFGPTSFENTFGCGIISKYPITKLHRHVLPSPVGEFACLVHAWLDVQGTTLQVYVGHFGNTPHKQDLRLQSQVLGSVVKQHRGNAIFLGYMTTPPEESHYRRIARCMENKTVSCTGEWSDTAYSMYRERFWTEVPTKERRGMPPPRPDDYKRNLSAPVRHFFYPSIARVSTAHPRFEFEDRYCQYILYRPEAMETHDVVNRKHLELKLVDWYRILDTQDSSDTEIQVAKFMWHLPQFEPRKKELPSNPSDKRVVAALRGGEREEEKEEDSRS